MRIAGAFLPLEKSVCGFTGVCSPYEIGRSTVLLSIGGIRSPNNNMFLPPASTFSFAIEKKTTGIESQVLRKMYL